MPYCTASFQPSVTCCVELRRAARLALFRPFADRNQVILQALDRIAERPLLVVVLRPIARRIVAGRMRGGAIRDVLDQRRARARARALGRPLRDRVHGEEIVAVDANARESRSPARARRTSAASPPAKPWNVEIAHWLLTMLRITGAWYTEANSIAWWKSASALEPSPIQLAAMCVFALDRRRHRPAHGLRKLRARLPEIEKMPPSPSGT